jgi:quinoprotein glucose dehydrogenase
VVILRRASWLSLAMLLSSPCGVSQAQTRSGERPLYNRDLAGTRHSPLDQINTANVASLERAWSYPLGRNATTSIHHIFEEIQP